MPAFRLRLRDDRIVSLSTPSVMGIINLSPDSFYRPYSSADDIRKTIEQMVVAGADFIDVGGEATNLSVDLNHSPNVQQQLDRVLPWVEWIARQFPVLISVDTSEPQVMREAVARGAHLINDQRGLQRPGALATVAELKTPVCVMHFFTAARQPGSCSLPELLAMMTADLSIRAGQCRTAGLSADQIIIDPGFGQGHYCKNAEENYYLLAHLDAFTSLGFPVLTGWSRKSMIGDTLGVAAPQRLYGSIAAATLAAVKGAAILRVHDVAETRDAVNIFRAMDVHYG